MDDDPRTRRRRRLHRAAARHPDVPDDIAENQINKVDEGVELLGGTPELEDAAEDALEKTLETVEDAQTSGAQLAETDHAHHD